MRVCVIGGDGIGPEVTRAGVQVLRALVTLQHELHPGSIPELRVSEAEVGWGTFQRLGTALPDETLAAAKAADAVLFGAVASPSYPVQGYRSPIVALRKALDLYANIRPTLTLPLKARRADVDLVIVRENTEGLYAGRERLEDDGATAIAERVITRRASERITHTAFRLARERAQRLGRAGRVTVVHKANVLRVSDGLFRGAALEVAGHYPDITVDEMLVDVAAMHLAQSPQRFDVVVTTNMFGDILSDVACIHGGGLGVASSANIGDDYALFEPVHGAAPDIIGKGIANPLAALECVAMLLERQGQRAAENEHVDAYNGLSLLLRRAIGDVLRAGALTPDLGGTATTEHVTKAVIAAAQAAVVAR